MNSTALRAEKLKNIGTVPVSYEAVQRLRSTQNTSLVFKDGEHEKFYYEILGYIKHHDCYHRALVYLLGISGDTRDNFRRIYDAESGCVRTECLREGWQTSGCGRIIRMAFNLYCNGTPSVYNYEEQLKECQCYTVEDIFCCEYAVYFWKAVKIRYPEYILKGTRGLEERMLKIRMQGTRGDLEWFKKLLERHEKIKVMQVSEAFANKGTKKFFRMYTEVEKVKR